MQELHIFLFYLAIIVVASSATYKLSGSGYKMEYSLYAAILGAVVSIILWNKVGKASITL